MTAMHTNNPTTITRLRAALAQTSNDQRCKLATFSTEDETYRPDCDSTWLDIRALSGLARMLIVFASHHIDALPPVAVQSDELPPLGSFGAATAKRLNERLLAIVCAMPDCTMEDQERYSINWLAADVKEGALMWALDHVDAFLAWLPERLAKVELVPELVDIAERAAQHSATYREARLSFRRTYGRQPRKAELASLGPWMRHVERYRARAEQLCAGRPELLRWYIDHVDIVVDAPSWSDPAVAGSRALGLRLLARSDESNHARMAVA